MPCPICDLDNDYNEKICQKRAAHAAHLLAMKECERNVDARFDYVDVYTTMFRRIYEHEYRRNMYLERERTEFAIRIASRYLGDPLCEYHDEFDIDFHTKTMKKVRHAYSISKWPNTLPNGA